MKEHVFGDGQAHGASRAEVEDEIERTRQLDRQIAERRTAQDAVDVRGARRCEASALTE
jgi:hypothetical protein